MNLTINRVSSSLKLNGIWFSKAKNTFFLCIKSILEMIIICNGCIFLFTKINNSRCSNNFKTSQIKFKKMSLVYWIVLKTLISRYLVFGNVWTFIVFMNEFKCLIYAFWAWTYLVFWSFLNYYTRMNTFEEQFLFPHLLI